MSVDTQDISALTPEEFALLPVKDRLMFTIATMQVEAPGRRMGPQVEKLLSESGVLLESVVVRARGRVRYTLPNPAGDGVSNPLSQVSTLGSSLLCERSISLNYTVDSSGRCACPTGPATDALRTRLTIASNGRVYLPRFTVVSARFSCDHCKSSKKSTSQEEE